MTTLMDIEQLKALVNQGESHTLEFKKSTTQLKPAFETLCGFLNAHGGIVLIGVNDGGKIIGQDVTDATRRSIAHELSKIEPAAHVAVNYIAVGGDKEVIVFQTLDNEFGPYVYDRRPYVRSQSTTSEMTQVQYKHLIVKSGQHKHAWDETIAKEYKISDLDHEEVRRTILQGVNSSRITQEAVTESIPDILNRLKLTKDGRLKHAAVALFAKDVEGEYPQLHIRMARFNGLTKTAEFLDNQSFYGNAFRILERANEFVMRHLQIASSYQQEGLERIDTPALPILAVREALINAIAHRLYTKRNSSISLAIYDDRLEIWNPGKLAPELTISDLSQTHESVPRNELVCKVLYIRNLIESWGTGTNKMIDLCRDQGLLPPEFSEHTGGFSVTFKFKETFGHSLTVKPKVDQLTPRQILIVNLLKQEGELATRNILPMISPAISERTLNNELLILKDKGIINSKGQTRKKVWFIFKHP